MYCVYVYVRVCTRECVCACFATSFMFIFIIILSLYSHCLSPLRFMALFFIIIIRAIYTENLSMGYMRSLRAGDISIPEFRSLYADKSILLRDKSATPPQPNVYIYESNSQRAVEAEYVCEYDILRGCHDRAC
jgi:hypothetical protein